MKQLAIENLNSCLSGHFVADFSLNFLSKLRHFIFIMFGLFGDPFFGYNPYGSFAFPRKAYKMLDLLNDMIENDSSDEEEAEEKQKDAKDKSKPAKSSSYNKYSQIKKSYYDGGNVIEELREKTCDGSSGSVKETTTRRIGNKWCTIEEETNNKGEKTTREKWHNVPENEVEKFKAKWEKHKGSFGFEHLSLPAPKEEKKE